MIIMIRIVNTLMQQIIPSGTISIPWQNDFFSQPFVSLLLWHILLFFVIMIIYFESIHGFQRSINIINKIFQWLKQKNKKNEIEYMTSKYKENSRRVYLSSALTVVAFTLIIALIINFKLVFFTVVISDSMNPTFQKGDLVLMQKINVKPEIGDIITFKVPDVELPITHRISSISGNEVRMKGDANPNEDSWRISKNEILGEIVVISGKQVIVRNLGEYFLVDASQKGRTYGPEFNAVSTLIKSVKFSGFVIFVICIILYLAFSVRDSRRIKW